MRVLNPVCSQICFPKRDRRLGQEIHNLLKLNLTGPFIGRLIFFLGSKRIITYKLLTWLIRPFPEIKTQNEIRAPAA